MTKGKVRDRETLRFFPGCLIPAKYLAMEFAIGETLPKLGIETVDLEDASCCPDPI
jgi:heterodisulfide reductase subunit B